MIGVFLFSGDGCIPVLLELLSMHRRGLIPGYVPDDQFREDHRNATRSHGQWLIVPDEVPEHA
jgi:hypothetical protein